MRRSRIKFTSLKSGILDKTDALDKHDVLDESSPRKDNNNHVINSKDRERQKRRINEANLDITIDQEEKEEETDESYDYDNDLDQELLNSSVLSPIHIEKKVGKKLDRQIDKENKEFADDDYDGNNNNNYNDENDDHDEEITTQMNSTFHRSHGVKEYVNNSSSLLQSLTSKPNDDVNTRKISNELIEKVTSFEKEKPKISLDRDGDIKRRKISENSRVDTESAESTILKITEFINSKRKELRELERKAFNGGTAVKTKKNNVTNNKNNLMKKIKRLSYNYDWTMDEWIALYQYLKLWKDTEDDRLLDSYRLEKLFNCNVEELQIRIRSLKNLIDTKKRSSN